MIPDLDTWRAAQLLVKRHGKDAAIQAGIRADELLAEGDVDGAATWRAIIRAVSELHRAAPREGEAVN
jgi:triphosphoribosyl-dephospho-CoA synthetase